MPDLLAIEGLTAGYGNGVPGSYLDHNSYCEANGITIWFTIQGGKSVQVPMPGGS